MSGLEAVDIAILGAGPAGCCAALRLLTLGYRVAVVERRRFPRPQIGEALSPGVGEILEYVGAAEILRTTRVLEDLPARVRWQQRAPELTAPQGRRGSLVVDRAEFDAGLLERVADRGGEVIQPARARHLEPSAEGWRLVLERSDGSSTQLRSRLVLDATGRSARNAGQRFATAPTTFAVWSHVAPPVMPRETRLEALANGWLWGTPLPGGRYRVMAFLDPAALPRRSGLERFFRALLLGSELFAAAAGVDFASPVRVCSATPYLDLEPCRRGILKVGESAFAVDPLSSSGVEKALRTALQAAIVANTVLCNPADSGFATEFYESRLLESAATHAVWTRDFYRQAWPGGEPAFWHDRSRAPACDPEQPAPIRLFHEACAEKQRHLAEPPVTASTEAPERPDLILSAPVHLSSQVRFVEVACVVEDRVRLRAAVTHPAMRRPLAFVDDCDVVPLLRAAPAARSLGDLIALWAASVPARKAARIAGWLHLKGLLRLEAP